MSIISGHTDINGHYKAESLLILTLCKLHEVFIDNQNICISFLEHSRKYASRTVQLSEDAGKQR